MNKINKKISSVCPSCYSDVHFGRRPRLGEVIICRQCEEPLEVVRLKPLKLTWSLMGEDDSWVDVNAPGYEDDYDRYDHYH